MTKNPHIKYRADIDGLRAIAIISVIAFHFYSSVLPSGFIGVDVFFVISGYLITKIILKEQQENLFSFQNFYLRRIRRIFPALFFMLFCSSVLAFLILANSDMIWFARSLHYASLQISNFFFQRSVDYFDQNTDSGPLLHTWSLGVEEQFYLLLPLLLVILRHFKKDENSIFYTLLALSIISLIASQYLVLTNQKVAFYSILSRFWELGIGCLIAFSKVRSVKIKGANFLSAIGFAMIILAVFVIKYSSFPGITALLPCLGAALIIVSGENNKTAISNFLSRSPFTFIGKISYSLYLWHLPIIVFYQNYTNHIKFTLNEILVIMPILFIISYLSWRFIENPFRKSSREYGKNPTIFKHPFLLALLAILFMSAISKSIQKTGGMPFRLAPNSLLNDSDLAEYGTSAAGKFCGIAKKSSALPELENCVFGENKKSFEAVLFGDSHASHYAPAIEKWANINHLSIATSYVFSCPPFLTKEPDQTKDQQCNDFRVKIWQDLSQRPHIKYVFFASSWYDIVPENKEDFRKKFSETIERLTALNKTIIVLGRVPNFVTPGGTPLKCLEKNSAPIQKILPNKNDTCTSQPLSNFDQQLEFESIMKEVVSKHKNILFYDPFSFFCDSKECRSDKDDTLLYADSGHMNKNSIKLLPSMKFFDYNQKKFREIIER